MDWKNIIAEIRQHGLSYADIASKCDCGPTTVNDLATGETKEPRHALGEALKSLLERCRAGEFAASKVA